MLQSAGKTHGISFNVYLQRCDSSQATEQLTRRLRQRPASEHGPCGKHADQSGTGQQPVVQLHCSCVLKEAPPALSCPILIRHPLPIHVWEVVVCVASVHARHKYTCGSMSPCRPQNSRRNTWMSTGSKHQQWSILPCANADMPHRLRFNMLGRAFLSMHC